MSQQLADLDRVIRTIANNVNQMARYSHTVWELLDERELFQNVAALRSEYIAVITRAATAQRLRSPQDGEHGPW
jgi:hypothetical protein